jgi:hypothetical protein
MVPNYRHLYFLSLLKNSILYFFGGTKLQTPLGQRYQIADTFEVKGTKLQTPLKLKVPNCRHLYCEKYLKADTFKAKGTKLQTPLLFITRLSGGSGTKLQTPLRLKASWLLTQA